MIKLPSPCMPARYELVAVLLIATRPDVSRVHRRWHPPTESNRRCIEFFFGKRTKKLVRIWNEGGSSPNRVESSRAGLHLNSTIPSSDLHLTRMLKVGYMMDG